MKNSTKGKIIKATALVIDVAAPLAATISQFPVWVDKSAAATMSGLFVCFALLSIVPFLKQIKMWLASPSAWSMWCVFTVIFLVLRNIIDQMTIIAVIGFVGNVIGAFIHKIGVNVAEKPDANP